MFNCMQALAEKSFRTSSLSIAITANSIDEVNRLLAEGLDPNFPLPEASNDQPILSEAIYATTYRSNAVLMIESLLKHGANPNVIYRRGRETPLIQLTNTSTLKNDALIEIASLLLKYGADINLKNKKGVSALENIHFNYNEEFAIFLVKNNATINDKIINRAMSSMYRLAEAIYEQGVSPYDYEFFAWSISSKNNKILEQLLNNGFDPNSFTPKHKTYSYPVIFAARYKNLDALKLLHQYGAKINVVGDTGFTVRKYAERYKQNDVLIWLNENQF